MRAGHGVGSGGLGEFPGPEMKLWWGVAGRFKKATARGSSACGSAGKVAGISGGHCGWPFARARRGGDEAGRRARGAVRERATRAAGSRARSRPGWSGGAVEWAAERGERELGLARVGLRGGRGGGGLG